jgi:hypothetical protein
MSARSLVTTAICQPVRAACLLCADKQPMSATTMPGHGRNSIRGKGPVKYRGGVAF